MEPRLKEGSLASSIMLSSRLMFTKSVTVSVAVSKVRVVLIKHMSGSQCTVLLGYLTISRNVRCYYCFIYNNKTVHRCILHSTQSNCCSAKLSISFLLSYGPITAQSLTPWTMRFRESYSSMSMSCR